MKTFQDAIAVVDAMIADPGYGDGSDYIVALDDVRHSFGELMDAEERNPTPDPARVAAEQAILAMEEALVHLMVCEVSAEFDYGEGKKKPQMEAGGFWSPEIGGLRTAIKALREAHKIEKPSKSKIKEPAHG